MSIFGGQNMDEQSGSGAGSYFKVGNYVAQLTKCFVKEGHKGTTFIAEFKVLVSDNEDVKVGGTRTFVQKLKPVEYPKMAYGNVADFMRVGKASMLDLLEEKRPKDWSDVKLPDEEAEAIIGKENPIEGAIYAIECVNIITTKKKDFTKHIFDVPDLEVIQEHA